MNANSITEPFELDRVSNELYKSIKKEKPKNKQEIIIPYYANDAEDSNEYIEALIYLKKNKIIEDYKKISTEEKIIPIKNQHHRPVFCLKVKHVFTPKILMEFMVKTSRLPKYSLGFDKQKRRLILNNKYILCTTHFNSPNYYFIDYAIKNPSIPFIKKKDIEKTAGELNSRFHTIVEQIIKNRELRKAFFPQVSSDRCEFENNITAQRLIEREIQEKKIKSFLKTLPTIK